MTRNNKSSEDYLETEKNPITETKILKGLSYEAPAIFKVDENKKKVFVLTVQYQGRQM